tara:strand:+ start:2551 stop:2691 length:141 start_codon:yes stop_codon:yes gene_type:complete
LKKLNNIFFLNIRYIKINPESTTNRSGRNGPEINTNGSEQMKKIKT